MAQEIEGNVSSSYGHTRPSAALEKRGVIEDASCDEYFEEIAWPIEARAGS
jgi:hypothetical protein